MRVKKQPVNEMLLYVFIAFGALALIIYLRAFLDDLFKNTFLFPILFPDSGYGFPVPWALQEFSNRLALVAGWVTSITIGWLQGMVLENHFLLIRRVVIIPVFEELLWRGPLRLLHRLSESRLWWIPGGLSVALYTGSHAVGPANLAVIFAGGFAFSMLVKLSGRLWPSILLHALLNVKNF